MLHWVYILYSETTDSFYKGQTSDLQNRIYRHNNKWEKATQAGVPWKLVWRVSKPDRSSAIILERKLKNLSRKKLVDFILKNPEGIAGPDVP
jgi:putative endonuclease